MNLEELRKNLERCVICSGKEERLQYLPCLKHQACRGCAGELACLGPVVPVKDFHTCPLCIQHIAVSECVQEDTLFPNSDSDIHCVDFMRSHKTPDGHKKSKPAWLMSAAEKTELENSQKRTKARKASSVPWLRENLPGSRIVPGCGYHSSTNSLNQVDIIDMGITSLPMKEPGVVRTTSDSSSRCGQQDLASYTTQNLQNFLAVKNSGLPRRKNQRGMAGRVSCGGCSGKPTLLTNKANQQQKGHLDCKKLVHKLRERQQSESSVLANLQRNTSKSGSCKKHLRLNPNAPDTTLGANNSSMFQRDFPTKISSADQGHSSWLKSTNNNLDDEVKYPSCAGFRPTTENPLVEHQLSPVSGVSFPGLNSTRGAVGCYTGAGNLDQPPKVAWTETSVGGGGSASDEMERAGNRPDSSSAMDCSVMQYRPKRYRNRKAARRTVRDERSSSDEDDKLKKKPTRKARHRGHKRRVSRGNSSSDDADDNASSVEGASLCAQLSAARNLNDLCDF